MMVTTKAGYSLFLMSKKKAANYMAIHHLIKKIPNGSVKRPKEKGGNELAICKLKEESHRVPELPWAPEGKRRVGRPQTTTVVNSRKRGGKGMGLTPGREAKTLARDRGRWTDRDRGCWREPHSLMDHM